MKKLDALYGALLGDACGVPYEFKAAYHLPSLELIDMVPPAGFIRSYPNIKPGTWSDDGALLLCLLQSLMQNSTDETVYVQDFAHRALGWARYGFLAVDYNVFDIGNQTRRAIDEIEYGIRALDRTDGDFANGNGSLMRGLAPALVATSAEHAHEIGTYQTIATHNTELCKAACGAYAALAYLLLNGMEFEDALKKALSIKRSKLLASHKHKEPCGTGFVADSFWSAVYAMRQGTDFKSVIRYAISLGEDTDTTACIAGGLAGAIYPIPQDWLDQLRGRELLIPFEEYLK